jgi:hypothetical protein
MKRTVITLFLCLVLAVTQKADSQPSLSKRVLVYLDLSGSMEPLKEGPFSKTVEAIQLLLGEKGFLGPGDEVRIFLFGDGIVDDVQWSLTSPPGTLLADLRQRVLNVRNDPSRTETTSWTDFRAVLENLQSQFTRDTDFKRQVVIVASDFLHDPSRSGPAKTRDHWQRVLADWQETQSQIEPLKKTLGDADRNPFLLGVAPLIGGGELQQQVRDSVLKSFKKITGDEDLNLGPGGLGAEELAQKIRRRLYFPLKVVVRSNRRERRLQVEVENPNAAQVEIDRIELTCLGTDGKPTGDAIQLSTTGTDLAQPIAANSQGKGELDLGSASCLRGADKFKVRVTSKEGAVGEIQRDVSWIDAEEVESSAVERNGILKRSILRIIVRMRGEDASGGRFQISVRRDGAQDGPVIADGFFYAPESLDPFILNRYLFTFSIRGQVREDLAGENLKVQVATAKELTANPENDTQSSRASIASVVAGAGSFFITVIIVIFSKKSKLSRMGLGRALEISYYISSALSGLASFALFSYPLLRQFILERFRFLSGPSAWAAVLAVCLGALAYGVSMLMLNNKLARIAYGPEAPNEELFGHLEKDLRKPRNWALAMAALVFVLGVLGVFGAPSGGHGAEPVLVTPPSKTL